MSQIGRKIKRTIVKNPKRIVIPVEIPQKAPPGWTPNEVPVEVPVEVPARENTNAN